MAKHRLIITVDWNLTLKGKFPQDEVLEQKIAQAIADLSAPKIRVESVEFESDEAIEDFAERCGCLPEEVSAPIIEFVIIEGKAVSVRYDTEDTRWWR